MNESDEKKKYLNPNLALVDSISGVKWKLQQHQTKSKFQNFIVNEIVFTNAAVATHLMNGLILLIDDPGDVLDELLKNNMYSDMVPEYSDGDGKITLDDPGIQKYTTLAMYGIQAIAEKQNVELDEDKLKLAFRSMIGYSLKWVENNSTTLEISTHFSDYILPDVLERIKTTKEEE